MTLKSDTNIHFAVLGPGNISHRFLKGLRDVEEADILAFASRNPDHVKEYAEAEGVRKIYRFDDLLKDEEINAVYVSTPPYVHYDAIQQLLNAGKNVLCEKPMCRNGLEAAELYKLAEQHHACLMEAQKNVFLPAFKQIKAWMQGGRIGTLCAMDATFARTGDNVSSYKISHSNCSDVPYEIGGYPLSEIIGLLDGKIDAVYPFYQWKEDKIVTAVYFMRSGNITMTANASGYYDRPCLLNIYGTLGRIQAENFWKTHEVKLILNNGKEEIKKDSFESEFTFEIQEFVNCILNGKTCSSIWKPEYSIQMLNIIAEETER